MDTIKGIPSTVKQLPDLLQVTHYVITRLGPREALSVRERAVQDALNNLMDEYAELDALDHPNERKSHGEAAERAGTAHPGEPEAAPHVREARNAAR